MTRSRVLAQLLFCIATAHLTVASARGQAAGAARADSVRADSVRAARERRDTLESVIIHATRAPTATGAAVHTVSRQDIQRSSSGHDAPLTLGATPSMSAYSDAGGFSGYSYLRLRGIDQSRINITVDGVPLNDPEDQVMYFSNFPDFMGSMSSVQIGRGVGASNFGTASFAGSLSFESVPLATTPRGGQAELSGGSFGTWRSSVQGATGVGSRGIAAYGRFTRQGTRGYRDRSGNDGWSGFGSVGWFGVRDAVKLTAISGLSATRLAYYAAPESDLAVNRRANPLSDAEGDRFHQELVSVKYSRAIANGLNGTMLVYRNSAAGTYDVNFGTESGAGSPGVGSFGLAHVWHGVTSAVTWNPADWALAVGGTATDYHRDHFLTMRSDPRTELYRNTGVKREATAFVKAAWQRDGWRIGADLLTRYARFRYRPSANADFYAQPVTWSFVNPKLGVSWDRGRPFSLFATAGRAWREPARSDLLAGADDLNRENANNIVPLSQVRAERVNDFEAGVAWRFARGTITVNAFAMEFRNEIAPIGALSLTGAPLRKNVPESYRRGVEFDGTAAIPGGSTLTGNVSIMRSRISEYDDEVAGVVYTDVAPLLTPPVSANLRWDVPVRGPLAVSFSARYVDPMHLANDGNAALMVPTQTMLDMALHWARGANAVRLDINNVLNVNAYASGYTDGSNRYLYPIATRNVMVTVRRGSVGR